MQVYQYQFDTRNITNEFIVAATTAEDALKLFDVSRREFKEQCHITRDQQLRETALGNPGKVLFRDSLTQDFQALDANESILNIRLKWLFNDVRNAHPGLFN